MIEGDWADRVRLALTSMGDADYQLRAWNGLGPEVSSLDEVVAQLFDDALFIDFVNEHQKELGSVLFRKALDLKRLVSDLDFQRLREQTPDSIIRDPEWMQATQIAVSLGPIDIQRSQIMAAAR